MSPWGAVAVAVVVAVPAACALAILLARRIFLVVTVAGTSMEPALAPGDRVLVRRQRRARARVGDILVFRDPDGREAIKRVAARDGDVVPGSVRPAVGGAEVVPPGMLVLLGDGARSGDSRHWGFIPASQALGLVVRRLPAAARLPGGQIACGRVRWKISGGRVHHSSSGSSATTAKIPGAAAWNASWDSHRARPIRRSLPWSRHAPISMRPGAPAAAASTRRIDASTSSTCSGLG